MGCATNHVTAQDQAEARRIMRMLLDDPPSREPDLILPPMPWNYVKPILASLPEGSTVHDRVEGGLAVIIGEGTTAYRQAHPEFEGYWECGRCGAKWTFPGDGPKEHNMRYCPECGRRITAVVPWSEQEVQNHG